MPSAPSWGWNVTVSRQYLIDEKRVTMKKSIFIPAIYIILSMLFLFAACSSAPKKEEAPHEMTVRTLEDFFVRCGQDVNRAAKVVLDNDIIKNLTHLKMMDGGGRHYYLLERESISAMISAVTVGVYADYVLINKDGDIIYTRQNDDIFGKNVRTSLAKTPLKTCYENRDVPVFFHDVTTLNEFDGKYYILVSTKVKGGDTVPGIIILQFDVEKLRSVLDVKTDIIGFDGLYRLSGKNVTPLTPYEGYGSIGTEKLKMLNQYAVTLPSGSPVLCRYFSHGSIEWILVKGN